jgi:hypothetical protein
MGKPRNYWVLRGARGADARTRLLAFYAENKDPNVGAGEPRPDRKRLYIEPFSLPLAANHVMLDTALLPAWDALKIINPTSTYVKDVVGGTDTAVNVKSYKAPRIIRVTLDKTGTAARSNITNLPYMKYNHTSRSIPFGKGTGTDTIAEVAAELITAYTAQPGFSARLVPERA